MTIPALFYKQLKTRLTALGLLPISIRTILLVVNLMVLALPLGSLFFFRIYENQLVRETEVELIAQSAFIAEIYKKELRQHLPDGQATRYGLPLENPSFKNNSAYYKPQPPRLDLAHDIALEPRPDALAVAEKPDRLAIWAGSAIAGILSEAQRVTLSGIRVLDFQGITVSGRSDRGLSFIHVKEVRAALGGHYNSVIRKRISDEKQPGLTSISRGANIHVFTVFPVIVHNRLWGMVYLSRTPKSILKNIYTDRTKLVLASLTILALALLIALVTSWTIARPLRRLIGRIKLVSTGDPAAFSTDDVHGIREIALLSEDFHTMAQALETRSTYIKQFANHVSHEFKTPLTSIKGAAELLHDHVDDMSKTERERFVNNIIADTGRMELLVNRLLELARADNPALTQESSNLAGVLDSLQGRYSSSFLTLKIPENLQVMMSEEILDMILGNMLENARQHNASKVVLKAHITGRSVKLVISDNGDGISPANRKKIFVPFFTTRREQGGTGLGLGIVKSLLAHNKGSIRLDLTSDKTRFIIQVPLS